MQDKQKRQGQNPQQTSEFILISNIAQKPESIEEEEEKKEEVEVIVVKTWNPWPIPTHPESKSNTSQPTKQEKTRQPRSRSQVPEDDDS